MNDDRIDVAGLRLALDWTQQQLADYCDTDRSTVSKWESEPPTKGPALILLRQLRDRTQPQWPAAGNVHNLDAATPAGVVAGSDCSSQAGAGLPIQEIQEMAG